MGGKPCCDGPAVTWKEPKRNCGHKDKARQACLNPHSASLPLSPVLIVTFHSVARSFFSWHFLSLTLSLTSLLLRCIFQRGSFHVELSGLNAKPWASGDPGLARLNWPRARSLCSGQLAEQLQVKPFIMWNQRHCSNSTWMIFAEYDVTERRGEEGWNGKRLWLERYCVLPLLYVLEGETALQRQGRSMPGWAEGSAYSQ